MSYFLTISGSTPNVSDIAGAELIEASQPYILGIATQLASVDGAGPVFLVHDRETNTSDDLVCAAVDAVLDGANLGDTDLGKVLLRAAAVQCTVRLWDAGVVNPVTDRPLEVSPRAALVDTVASMAKKGHIKYVRCGAS